MTEREIEAVLREVTDEEVAFYQEYGWVMMKQLIDPAFSAELLRVGQAWRESKQGKQCRSKSLSTRTALCQRRTKSPPPTGAKNELELQYLNGEGWVFARLFRRLAKNKLRRVASVG